MDREREHARPEDVLRKLHGLHEPADIVRRIVERDHCRGVPLPRRAAPGRTAGAGGADASGSGWKTPPARYRLSLSRRSADSGAA